MDNEEAKFILKAYRPSGADAADPTFTGALAQAKQDPALGKWLQSEQALDRIVSEKLKKISPPAGLRESILAGGKVSRTSPAWWRQTSSLALAASLLVAIGISFTWSVYHRQAQVERMAQFAIEDVLHGHHGNHGVASDHLQATLENASFHLTNGEMPANLANLESTGCRTLSVAGHDVAEICFLRSGHYYHLYVMSRLGGMPSTPRIMDHDGGYAAAWTDDRNSYVVATTASLSELRNIL